MDTLPQESINALVNAFDRHDENDNNPILSSETKAYIFHLFTPYAA